MMDLLQLEGVTPSGYRPTEDGLLIIASATVNPPQACSSCTGIILYKHGTRTYQYADTPMHGKSVRIEIERQRFRCRSCGTVITPTIPSLDDKRVATRRLVEYIQSRSFGTTFTLLAKETGLVVNTIKSITQDYTESLEKRFTRVTPRLLGLDEVMIGGDYRFMLTNLEMHTVFDIQAKRTLAFLREYFKNLKDKENIEWVALDMWEPYQIVLREYVPNAKLVIDRFHVIAKASTALETLRIEIQKSLPRQDRLVLKKNIRWSLLKGEKKERSTIGN